MPQAALADVLTPDSPASSSASDTRTIYIVMLVLTSLAVLAVVGAILRAALGSRRESEPEHRTVGTRGVQRRVGIGLGVAAIDLFVVGIVFTEKVRDAGASESSADPISIQVTGQQWLWRYEYPEAEDTSDGYSADTPYSYYDLTIPVDTPITLNIGSTDVIHTWSVPALTRSVQAVPGDTQSVTFVADEEGTFYGHSNQFSGPGYATMRTAIHVVSQDEYEAFLAQRTKDIQAARAAVQKEVDNGTAPGVALEQ
jgi:cytochrome c oxidase subunit 2